MKGEGEGMDNDKPTQHWEDFQTETNRAAWWQRSLEHRRDGCVECLAGGCISAASGPGVDPK